MVIERPEAIDGAPVWAAASAEDGSQATFLLREECWRSRRGRKSIGAIAPNRSRLQPSFGQINHLEEAVWCARPDRHDKETVTAFESPQDTGISFNGDENGLVWGGRILASTRRASAICQTYAAVGRE
jgi:hypothetical protein